MRAKDFMMREEITIMADLTIYEGVVFLSEYHTGRLPVAENINQWIGFVKHLCINARQPIENIVDRVSTLQRRLRIGEWR